MRTHTWPGPGSGFAISMISMSPASWVKLLRCVDFMVISGSSPSLQCHPLSLLNVGNAVDACHGVTLSSHVMNRQVQIEYRVPLECAKICRAPLRGPFVFEVKEKLVDQCFSEFGAVFCRAPVPAFRIPCSSARHVDALGIRLLGRVDLTKFVQGTCLCPECHRHIV